MTRGTALRKDAQDELVGRLARSGLKARAQRLVDTLSHDPYQGPPPYEELVGDLAGAYSRRINIQHRLVYQILDEIKTVKII